MERGSSLLPGPRRVRSVEDDDPISDSEPQELPVAEIKITKTVDDKIESEHWVTLYADKDFVVGRDVTKWCGSALHLLFVLLYLTAML